MRKAIQLSLFSSALSLPQTTNRDKDQVQVRQQRVLNAAKDFFKAQPRRRGRKHTTKN